MSPLHETLFFIGALKKKSQILKIVGSIILSKSLGSTWHKQLKAVWANVDKLSHKIVCSGPSDQRCFRVPTEGLCKTTRQNLFSVRQCYRRPGRLTPTHLAVGLYKFRFLNLYQTDSPGGNEMLWVSISLFSKGT